MTANRFLFGVAFLYLGLIWFAIDFAYEPFFRRLPVFVRSTIGLAFCVSILLVSWKWIFVPAPVEIYGTSSVNTFGLGSKIDGIEWKPRYSEFRFDVKNASRSDYRDIDLTISTDLVIAEMKQTAGLTSCTMSASHPTSRPTWQRFSGSQPVGPANDPKWEYEVIPRDKDGKAIVPVAGADWSFRVRCDTLPANSEVDFISALEVVTPASQTGDEATLGTPLFEAPAPAKWFSARMDFQTGGRKRKAAIVQCRVNTLCALVPVWVW